MDKLFDRYSLQAQVVPSLIAVLPIALTLLAWFPKAENAAKPLIAIFVCTGAILLAAHLSREAGKSCERQFIERWGGWPTTLFLRYSDKTVDALTKSRYHAKLQRLVPDITLPTPAQELANPVDADAKYSSCANYLRAQTRAKSQFPLVFAENLSYGFRRNLLGVKPFAVPVSLVCVGAIGWRAVNQVQSPSGLSLATGLSLGGTVLLTVIWLLVIRVPWTRQAAERYALRLLESIDQLPAPAPEPSIVLKP